MSYERERAVAVEAVRRASRLCRAVQAELGAGDSARKADRSPVTVADYGAQAVIALALAEAFPGDGLMGEEAAPEDAGLRARVMERITAVLPRIGEREAMEAIDRGAGAGGRGRHWTVDPVDGTKGFLRGGQYAVALALLEDGEVTVGALGCPNLDGGRIFVAARGVGAREEALEGGDERDMRASTVSDPAKATICESAEAEHTSHEGAERIARALGIRIAPKRMDSMAKYAVVARGDADIYLRLPRKHERREKIWDHAAGVILVTEAGGRVTDLEGRALDFTGGRELAPLRGIVTCNAALHAAVLAAAK